MRSHVRRRHARALCVLSSVLLGVCGYLPAEVVFSELMYHPPQGEEFEFIEIYNTGPGAENLSGWTISNGVTFAFADGTSLEPGAFLLVAASREAFVRAHPALAAEQPAAIVGDYTGRLSNAGDEIALRDGLDRPRDIVAYDDALPWDALADGVGSSLERVCFSAPGAMPENWRPSPVPERFEVFGGSPLEGPVSEECPPIALSRPDVYLSEVMYHPVLEDPPTEDHEFVEIHNAGSIPIPLEGWRLAGGVEYEFPAGASIDPGDYVVVAADPPRLAEVAAYGLSVDDLLGPYERRIDNGGATLALVGAVGQGVDVLRFDDSPPWPAAADGLGVGESWLPLELLPIESHRYMGHSLERVSFETATQEIANWLPSPLDGATPGRQNAAMRSEPLPVVGRVTAQPVDDLGGRIENLDHVRIEAQFTPRSPSGAVELEYFLDDFTRTGETVETVEMTDDGLAGVDRLAGDSVYSVVLPPRPPHTIVRYRVMADRGDGREPISPRDSDPNPWHAYFVSPRVNTTSRLYHIYITPANWTRMWDNIRWDSGRRVIGCNPNPTWNARVPAIFVHEGHVYDVQVRYQGSRWNRGNGRNIGSYPYLSPSRPSPFRALSWRISFPRYNQFEGRSVTLLNKLIQACPGGFTSSLGYRLFAEAGLPAPLTRYARVHINGGYYHYMMEYERPGEDMLRRYHEEEWRKYPHEPREEVGHLFKSAGCNCDEGPYGWGNAQVLRSGPGGCSNPAARRYAYTYDRKTHEGEREDEVEGVYHTEFIALIDELAVARSRGIEAMREYFAEHFDIDLLLSYMAIINYQVPFDDMFQNYYIYQRMSDRRWILAPWDLDRNFGGWKGASSSVYVGEQGNTDNRSGWWNHLKDAFLKSYRQEFDDRLLLLNNTILHPDNIDQILNEAEAEANPAEAASAPGGTCSSFSATSLRSFARVRFRYINEAVAGIRVNAGPDVIGLAGSEIQFDARATIPDPGPDVTYTWSNGMEGDYPTYVFEEPGTYEVVLTVTYRDVPLDDTVVVTVLPRPQKAFRERDGLLVMEAERYWMNDPHTATSAWWEDGSDLAGFSGSGYVEAKSTRRLLFTAGYAQRAPELRYPILFEAPGSFRVWVRGYTDDVDYDTLHVNLDTLDRSSDFAHQLQPDAEAYTWSGDSRSEGSALVTVEKAGLHYLSVWIREPGLIVDKIILARDAEYSPEGLGPEESPYSSLQGGGPFVRGDTNGSASIDVTDPVAILLHLFQGGDGVACEDHADTDDNGKVELTDAVILLDFLFRRGVAPAPPFPDPGLDTTPDDTACGDS